jgi:hypothetical protein
MKELINRFIALERKRRGLEEQLGMLKEEKAKLEEQLLEAFTEQGIQNMKLEGGITVSLRTDVRASILADRRDEAYELFKENGLDGMVKETIHPKTLESWVREHRGVNGISLPEWAEGLVSTYEQTRPTILGLK